MKTINLTVLRCLIISLTLALAGHAGMQKPSPAWPAWTWRRSCTVRKPYEWNEDRVGARPAATAAQKRRRFHVVAFDYGVKHNILRMLAERGCRVTVVPAQTPAAEVLELQARRHLPVQRPRRPGALRLRDRGDARTDRDRHPDLRHLPGPPDHGAGLRRQDLQDEVRPPRRQPPGEGPRQRPGQHHQPEPRLRGRREDAAGQPARRRTSRCSTARCRAWRAPTSRRSASRATRKPRPARTTSATCSTASRR